MAVGVECSSLTEIMLRSMGSIPMQDSSFSTVTDGRVDPAFHPPGIGNMGTVRPTAQKSVLSLQAWVLGTMSSKWDACKLPFFNRNHAFIIDSTRCHDTLPMSRLYLSMEEKEKKMLCHIAETVFTHGQVIIVWRTTHHTSQFLHYPGNPGNKEWSGQPWHPPEMRTLEMKGTVYIHGIILRLTRRGTRDRPPGTGL